MRISTLITFVFTTLAFAFFSNSTIQAQTSVLNPDDPIVVYNANNPPAIPSYGTLAKWVKTNRLSFNTSSFKAYYYKGVAFRLKFPKSYKDSINTGKKYPVFIFFHGIGEKGTIYDNEYQLYHGGQKFMNAVDNGSFDGFLLYPQTSASSGGFNSSQYQAINELITNYLVPQAHADINRVIVDGLSAGGTSSWNMINEYPRLIAAALPISASSIPFGDASRVNVQKYTPIWLFQGGLDKAPTPYTSMQVVNNFRSAGANIKYTEYPTLGHGCWNEAWSESDFIPFINRAHKANPWPLFGRTEVCPGDPISITIGVTAGFDGYEWRKNGVLISGANSNSYVVTSFGSYDCRIKRGNEWSVWSPIPVVIKQKGVTVSPDITLEGALSHLIPSPAGNSSVKLIVPEGYESYNWQKEGSGTVLSTTNSLTVSAAGKYKVKVTEQFGCSSEFSNLFEVLNANGQNGPEMPVNVNANVLSKTEIQISWQHVASGNNATGFEIYRSAKAGGPYTLINTNGANALTYKDSELNPNSAYYYKLRAINNAAASAATAEVAATTFADTIAPSAPSNLRTSFSTRNSVALIWGESTDDVGVVKYDVYVNGVKYYETEQTQFTVYNLVHGQTYTFRVKARDFAGNQSSFSNQASAQALLNGLTYKHYIFTGTWNNLADLNSLEPVTTGIVPNITLENRTQNENYAFLWEGYITIPTAGTYTFRTNSDDGSKLYLAPYNHATTPLVNNDGLHGAQNRDGSITLQAGTYPIAIAFYQQGGGAAMSVSWRKPGSTSFVVIPNSAFSDAPTQDGVKPSSPSNLQGNALSTTSIALSWSDNSNNEVEFEIWRSTTTNDNFSIVGNATANSTTYTNTGLEPGTKYYYKVLAINQYGEAATNEAGVEVSTLPLPIAPFTPINLEVAALSSNSNKITWDYDSVNTVTVSVPATYAKIEAENYIAMFGVQKEGSSEGGQNVGYIEAGDWMDYSFNAPITGTYSVNYRVAATSANSDHIQFKNAAGTVLATTTVPNTGGWQNWTTVSATVNLNAGEQTIRVYANKGGFNINWFELLTTASIKTIIDTAHVERFELYRSINHDQNFELLAALPFDARSYTDATIQPNTLAFYKVRAINEGGNSPFSNIDSSTSQNVAPILDAIEDYKVRYGTQLEVVLNATDTETDVLTYSFTNLPAFGIFTSTGNGKGKLTFNPALSNVGSYVIKVTITDSKGASDTASFQLVVNDNYLPKIATVSNVVLNELQTLNVNLSATDNNNSDSLIWSFSGLPGFVHVTINNRSAGLQLTPGYTDNGVYHITAYVNDGNEGVDSVKFIITVNDVNPNKTIYVNFGDATYTAAAPWNNTAKSPVANDLFANLKDDAGATTSVSIQLMSAWTGINNLGSNTGNNSGVYPDAVLRSSYYTAGDRAVKIAGLSTTNKYNLSFVGSRANPTVGVVTTYTIGGQTLSLNASNNTQNVVTFNGIVPNPDGAITFTVSNASGSMYGYLNGLVIQSLYDDGSVPATPRALVATNVVETGNVQLKWTDAAFNETAYEVYRATALSGPYILLNAGGNNANLVEYNDATVKGNTTYFYTVKALNNAGSSNFSDTVSIVTSNVNPTLQAIANVSMTTQQTLRINISATDPGDVISLSVQNLPSFATFIDNGNGTGYIDIVSGNNLGAYNGITITATDNHGGQTSTSFDLSISAANLTRVFVNFNQTDPVGSPWNSMNAAPTANRALNNLKDEMNQGTGIDLTLLDAWTAHNTLGVVTGNNSGVYLDNVMRTFYYYSGTGERRVKISGLSQAKKYDFTFFASRANNATPLFTRYTIGGESVELNATNNSSQTVTISGVSPDINGEIIFSALKINGSPNSYLGALVIEAYDNIIESPSAPTNLEAAGLSKTQIKLNWGKTVTASAYEVWRSSTASGTYIKIADLASASLSYIDANLAAATVYYYKVRAIANNQPTDFSNYAGASTVAYSINLNLNDGTANAPAQGSNWNNTNALISNGFVLTNMINDQGMNTGINFEVVTNFSGFNYTGATTGNNTGVYPDNVMKNFYYLNYADTARLKITGLTLAHSYNFVFFGSRANPVVGVTTAYKIGGEVVTLNAANNTQNIVKINGVKPDADGSVSITIYGIQSGGFGYLNAMTIEGAPSVALDPALIHENNTRVSSLIEDISIVEPVLQSDKLSSRSIAAYPNPFVAGFDLTMNLTEKSNKFNVVVRDISGRLVYTQEVANAPQGLWKQRIQLNANLQSGIYLVQIIGLPGKQIDTIKLIKK